MQTQVIKVEAGGDFSDALATAAQVLAGGGLVAFPTETVYGLAARVDVPASYARLTAVKERPGNKPFTLHIGDKEALRRYVPRQGPLSEALLRKAWPGPLTAVFTLTDEQCSELRAALGEGIYDSLYWENTIGVRLPDHPVGRAFLSAADGPVVAPSANPAGAAPPNCGDDVLAGLDGQIDLVLDAGPTRYAKASTVVRLGGEDFEILREGVLDAGAVRRMRQFTVLFVCTGNTCRSPMAAGLCRVQLAEKLGCGIDQLAEKGYIIESAGSMAYEGAPASPESVQAGGERGADISGHRAQAISPALLGRADAIWVMTESHRQAVLRMAPQAAGRVALLGGEQEVSDPIGMGIDEYRRCAEQMSEALSVRWTELLG